MALRSLHALARAFGDIFPMPGIVIDGRGARATRAGAGGAIVLAGKRNPVALVRARLRGGGTGLGGGGGRAAASEQARVAAVMADLAFMGVILCRSNML